MIKKYLYNHTTEDTAYLVADYPYGFRLRTNIRYWIETTKAGDRFCAQTLNPKTGAWNKPKKSTYDTIMFMGLDELDHVTRQGISKGWTKEEEAVKFIEAIGGLEKLSPAQLQQYKLIIAISRTQDNLKFKVVDSTDWTKEEREANDKRQAETEKEVQKIFSHELAKL